MVGETEAQRISRCKRKKDCLGSTKRTGIDCVKPNLEEEVEVFFKEKGGGILLVHRELEKKGIWKGGWARVDGKSEGGVRSVTQYVPSFRDEKKGGRAAIERVTDPR